MSVDEHMKVIVETKAPVTTVIINRPERRNAVDSETAQMLREAFEAFEQDDEQAVAVLCGSGETFCAGYDLKSVAEGVRERDEIVDPNRPGPMGPTRRLLNKPVLAAVEGYAVAGGLELSLWCDMRIASETAQFGVFCRRWGVPLIDGGTVRLPRLIGASRAMDMILTGRAVDAHEALSFGLVNRVVSAGQARAETEKLAHELARFPQLCLQADRLSAHQQWGMDMAEALQHEAQGGIAPLQQEAQRGAAQFTAGKGRGGKFE